MRPRIFTLLAVAVIGLVTVRMSGDQNSSAFEGTVTGEKAPDEHIAPAPDNQRTDRGQDNQQQAAEREHSQVPTFTDADVQFFEDQILPILKEHCYQCHIGLAAKGNLRMDYRDGFVKGGDTGTAISVDDPDASLLIEAVKHLSYEMPPPPADKLADEEIATLTEWIRRGLPWTPGVDAPPADAAGHSGPPAVNDETMSHWSFQPVERPAKPEVENVDWVRSPVDAFVLARLEAENARPAAAASKAELIRRVTYDLTGLPPSYSEVAEFLTDDSPEAYEKVVDRLLASPHFGEHWARGWLDLVRYAETNSYERDGAKPFAWRYRDYVITAFNADKPYDEFIREQIAGDELEEPTPESIIATGYYRLGLWDDEPADPLQAEFDELDDILSTTSQTFLGLTIGCARCHDHKLDPIPQKDYYRMLAFFTNIRRYGVRAPETVEAASVRMVGSEESLAKYEEDIAAWRAGIRDVQQTLRRMEGAIRPTLQGGERDDFQDESRRLAIVKARVPDVISQDEFDQYESLTKERDELRNSEPAGLDQALCVKELGADPRPTHLLVRGNVHVPGDEVLPAFPLVLGFPQPEIPESPFEETSGRRGVLANWLTERTNPLTSRVMVNRIWARYFRQGIVPSLNDYGLQGAPPTHQQLLDWLAAELMDGGWKLKRIHKLIVMSNAYRMSSKAAHEVVSSDPENKLLSRQSMRRLSAEEIRDSILAANKTLNRDTMFGPSVFTKIPAEVLAGQSQPGLGWGESSKEDRARRSIYIHIKRSLITPILASFDYPETDFSCPERFATTQPTQALGMINSAFILEQAELFAKSLVAAGCNEPATQVTEALRRVTQREPTSVEVQAGVDLLRRLKEEHGMPEDEALTQFCVVALNLNEFLYLD